MVILKCDRRWPNLPIILSIIILVTIKDEIAVGIEVTALTTTKNYGIAIGTRVPAMTTTNNM